MGESCGNHVAPPWRLRRWSNQKTIRHITRLFVVAIAVVLQVGGEKAPWLIQDGPTADYFKATPFRGHASVSRLNKIMNFSMPGLEMVADAMAKGDDFSVGQPILFLCLWFLVFNYRSTFFIGGR
jgi:hypothetical protein